MRQHRAGIFYVLELVLRGVCIYDCVSNIRCGEIIRERETAELEADLTAGSELIGQYRKCGANGHITRVIEYGGDINQGARLIGSVLYTAEDINAEVFIVCHRHIGHIVADKVDSRFFY